MGANAGKIELDGPVFQNLIVGFRYGVKDKKNQTGPKLDIFKLNNTF